MRLFDSHAETKKAEELRLSRKEVRLRAEAADAALQAIKETDEASEKLREALGRSEAVTPIVYQEFRPRGCKWLIEHSPVGEDYIFQLHPLKPPTVSWQDVIYLSITSMDVIFPRTLQIQYVPPSQHYQLKFFTIKVGGLVGLPGWTKAIERALLSLSRMDAWVKNPTAETSSQ